MEQGYRRFGGSGRCRRAVLRTMFVGALSVLLFAAPANAQYGADPSERMILGTGIASQEGTFSASYTAPDEIAEQYLIYAIGTDDDGEPFEFVVAQVTPAFAGLTWTLGGSFMQPGSEYTLEARYEVGTDLGPQVLGIQQLPDTGSETRALVGLGLVAVVIGGAAVYGARMTPKVDQT